MSITISTDVFCDCCKGAWIHGTTGSRPKAPEARREAARHGWERRRLVQGGPICDVCPECVEELA